jgi:hypothetical protein
VIAMLWTGNCNDRVLHRFILPFSFAVIGQVAMNSVMFA